MKVGADHLRTIRWANDHSVEVIDQRQLPHALVWARLLTYQDAGTAIREMWVRGAPLIGVAAAFGVALAMSKDSSDASLEGAVSELATARPTAINLRWALDRMRALLRPLPAAQRL